MNDALLFTFGGDGGQQVNVTLTAGAARTGAEVAGDIQAAFTAAGAPATAEPVSFGQIWIESPLDIAVEGTACATLGLDGLEGGELDLMATLTDHLGEAGDEGDWELIDSVSPVMTEGARKWIRDLASQFAAAGILASFAFSMEVYNPPAAMRAKYLSLAGGVVAPGEDVFLEVPSHQMHFGTRVRNYLKQMYKECADEIAAAGLPVVLQFGETQWWYFDNRASRRRRAGCRSMTRRRSMRSRRRKVTRFGRSLPTRMILLAIRRTRTRRRISCGTGSGRIART